MQEEEAHQEEEIFDEQEDDDDADTEMAEEEERGDVEPSGPEGVAGTEDTPPLYPAGDAVSPEEDAFPGLQRDGRSEPDLPEPTWAWGRRDSAVSLH